MALSTGKIKIDFIIPAYNEEDVIGSTIDEIKKRVPDRYDIKIIVVDNGSIDSTSDIVKGKNALCISSPEGTIAANRNLGASQGDGEILVFLDADVLLTDEWHKEIDKTVKKLMENPLMVTGSRCQVQDKNNWFAKYWFARMSGEKANYINSAHLITSRLLFDRVEGFSGHLRTGEDYDFGQKAKKAGAVIINNTKLIAVHRRYPETIKAFINRERWHGSQDFSSIKMILESKQAILVLLNICYFLTVLAVSIFLNSYYFIIVYIVSISFALIAMTMIKFKKSSFPELLNGALIYLFYMTGRTLSCLDQLSGRSKN